MVIPELGVRKADKILSINGKNLTLDKSFFLAKLDDDSNKTSANALNLMYRGIDAQKLAAERWNVGIFIAQSGLSEMVKVRSCMAEYPTVTLRGNYVANILS